MLWWSFCSTQLPSMGDQPCPYCNWPVTVTVISRISSDTREAVCNTFLTPYIKSESVSMLA